MSVSPQQVAGSFASAITAHTHLPVAPILLDGSVCLCTLDIDDTELQRRRNSGASGAVTDRATLSEIWQFQNRSVAGVPTWLGGCNYKPIGRVPSMSFLGRRSVASAIGWPPTFERVAYVESPSRAVIQLASAWGVGLAALVENTVEYIVAPAAPINGEPGVFRWWIAERTFEALSGANT
jgi:hypothetical protein